MRPNLILIFIACLGISACGKKNDNPTPTPTPVKTPTVTINGTAYPTVVIGTQSWTTVDYKGAGAMVVPVSSLKDTAYLFTYAQAADITPPDGWRLPSAADFSKLCTFLGGKPDSRGYATVNGSLAQMLTTADWPQIAGTNSTKFTANYVGAYYSNIPGYNFAGVGYWSTTPDSFQQLDFFINVDDSSGSWVQSGAMENSLKTDGYCIRFVKDN